MYDHCYLTIKGSTENQTPYWFVIKKLDVFVVLFFTIYGQKRGNFLIIY